MLSKRAMYGTYLVIWFKGTWFDLPETETIRKIRDRMIPDIPASKQSELSELEFTLVTKTAITHHLRNIRVFVLDVSKPVTASKKGK
jgi:hypothetical protein